MDGQSTVTGFERAGSYCNRAGAELPGSRGSLWSERVERDRWHQLALIGVGERYFAVGCVANLLGHSLQELHVAAHTGDFYLDAIDPRLT
jgi:hypothetical protein